MKRAAYCAFTRDFVILKAILGTFKHGSVKFCVVYDDKGLSPVTPETSTLHHIVTYRYLIIKSPSGQGS